ncbi:MAG: BTAD domain-containing putative transcriptional regulator [Peptococcia bacterium]
MRQRVYLASKFIVPSLAKDVILVKSFMEKIKDCGRFPLTLIKAGPGYGKSTSIGFYFKNFGKRYYWFNLSGDNNELFNFIFDLIHSVRISNPNFGQDILKVLDETESLRDNWEHIINMFINGLWELYGEDEEEIYLIIEDLHRVQDQTEILEVIIYLVNNLTPGIHLVITTRTLPTKLPWQQWKLKGKVQTISEEDLAFGEEDVRRFFAIRRGTRLDPEVVELILDKTEGWAIALEMLNESFCLEKIEDLDEEIRENSQELFSYLAVDVLDKQENELRDFLLKSSILAYLNESVCSHLIGKDGPDLMRQVIIKELFIYEYGQNNYRFHSLFKDFLQHTAKQENYPLKELHQRAAQYFLDGGYMEEAIAHLIKAEDYSQAIELINKISPDFIARTRFNTLLFWLCRLPEDCYIQHPELYVILGDIRRLTSEFHAAFGLYEKAEKLSPDNNFRSEVLQRKALVYLDTVQPSRAEPLLQEALDLKDSSDERELSGLFALIAENKLNSGKISEVLEIQERAIELGLKLPRNIKARLLLRTGRLAETLELLQEYDSADEHDRYSSRGQRETKLILSLVHALIGKGCISVYALAREGIEKSQTLGSPFTESVAAARMGHSYLLRNKYDEAIKWYLRAIQLSDQVLVPRGKGEPLWGLCLAYGMRGQWEMAFRYGEEGRKICLEANDFWLAAMNIIAMGIGCFYSGSYKEAHQYLNEGSTIAEQCKDPFLSTVGLLWNCLVFWRESSKKLGTAVEELLLKLKENGYEFLLTKRTLWGPDDPGLIQGMLRTYEANKDVADEILLELEKYLKGTKPDYHPGYTLFINTLGQFKVRRGGEEIEEQEWSRDKARRLLQILVGHRGQYVRSELLVEWLWPDKTLEQGKQNLKVIVNALNRILEPERKGHSPFFLERNNQGYGLVDTDKFKVDADLFLERIKLGIEYYEQKKFTLAEEVLEEALYDYKGDYLPDMVYEEWAIIDQEALRKAYIEAAEKLAQIYFQNKEWTKCLNMCEDILEKDCCYENAYQLMILCYCQMKEKILAVQTFQRYKDNLAKHLAIKPSHKLTSLLKEGIATI